MGSPIWVGCEDLEYASIGGASISTNTNFFRSSVGSRCALISEITGEMWQNIKPYSTAAFWFSARVMQDVFSDHSTDAVLLDFLDDANVSRIRIVGTGTTYIWRVEKVDSALNATRIGNLFFMPISIENGRPDKIDVHIVYDETGSIDIYQNGIHVFAYLGDNTTDGATALSFHRLWGAKVLAKTYWSETWLDEDDTRSRTIVGFDPVANGNANTFDTGSPSVSNINEVTLNDATLNGSSSAGQIDQYTNGAVPSGTLDVIALVISARTQRGPSGPSKIALGVRTNGANFWGSDQVLDVAWGNTQEIFTDNPDTGIPWLKSQIGAAVGFNIGSKSAA